MRHNRATDKHNGFMKKIAATVMVAALSIVTLVGCGSGNSDHLTGDELNDLLSTVGEKIVSEDTTLSEMTVDTSAGDDAELNFTAACDADYSKIEGYYHAYASDGTAGEITIISVKKSDDVTSVMNSLKSHIDTRRGTMENYSPEQVEIVDKAVVTHVGCYVGLFISEKSGLDKNNFVAELEANGIQ